MYKMKPRNIPILTAAGVLVYFAVVKGVHDSHTSLLDTGLSQLYVQWPQTGGLKPSQRATGQGLASCFVVCMQGNDGENVNNLGLI